MFHASTPRRLPVAVSAVSLVGLLVTGCSSGSTPAPTKVAGEPSSVTTVAAGAAKGELILPIDAYAFTFSEVGQLDRARQLIVRDCMRRFGFSYQFDEARIQQRSQNTVKDFGIYGNKRRYGPTDAAAAARYGYHSPSDVEGTRPDIDVAKEKASGSGAREMVLTGKAPSGGSLPAEVAGEPLPAGGCTGEADSRISPQKQLGDDGLVTQIAQDSFARSLTDPVVTAAFTQWSACMKTQGYDYPNPQEAGAEFDTANHSPTAKEITAAKRDVACKNTTHLVATWQGAEAALQNAAIEQHAAALRAIKTDKAAQLARAATAISTYS